MVTFQCKPVSPRSIVDEKVMPQCRAIFVMTKIYYKFSQVSML